MLFLSLSFSVALHLTPIQCKLSMILLQKYEYALYTAYHSILSLKQEIVLQPYMDFVSVSFYSFEQGNVIRMKKHGIPIRMFF